MRISRISPVFHLGGQREKERERVKAIKVTQAQSGPHILLLFYVEIQ